MRRRSPPPRRVGRPGVDGVPRPTPRFNLTRTPGFELWAAVEEEDRLRARLLRSIAKKDPGQPEALQVLADRIDPDVTAKPNTAASSRYMRDQRIRIIGALWELLYATRP